MDAPKKLGAPRRRRGPRGKLADGLRAARAARGLTQEQAAAELGIARGRLALMESGSRKPRGLERKYLELWIGGALGRSVELPGREPKEATS